MNHPADNRYKFARYAWKHKALYLMLLPGMIYFIVFKYVPLAGSVIAFQDYDIFKGFLGSEWVGLKWFNELFQYPQFLRLLKNTLIISFYQIIFAFPAPLIMAVLLNELRLPLLKRSVQTIIYLPHFLSWAVVYGLAYMMFSTQTGLVNDVIERLGGDPVQFLSSPDLFRSLVIGTGMWKEVGWSTIIFLAALSGINPTLYEAAKIDGAGRWKQFKHVTFPGLLPAFMILLLLKIGHVLDLGFEQIYVFLSPPTMEVGDIFDTYSYRAGIISGQFSMTTAIGIFKSVVGLALLVVANRLSKRTTGEGIY